MDPRLAVLVDQTDRLAICKVACKDADADQVKATVAELEAEALEAGEDHTDIHKRPPKPPAYIRAWYAPPKSRYQWGQPRHERHPSWGDLYFDLIYVGVIYKVGTLLGGEHGVTGMSLYIFVSCILVLYSAWMAQLRFAATIRAKDYFHRFMFLLNGLAVATAAHNLPVSIEILEEYENKYALGFTVSMIMTYLLQIVIFAEMVVTSDKESIEHKYGWWCIKGELLPVSALCVSVLAISLEASLAVVATTWLLSYLISRIYLMHITASKYLTQKNSPPWDISFTILRFTQLTMLCLGEGVLQIVIFQYKDESEAYMIALFVFSYVMLGMLLLLHYGAQPFSPSDHVLLRDRFRATFWLELYAVYSAAQISVGVALKKMMYIQSKMEDYSVYKKKKGYYWFLAGSLAVVLFLLGVQQLCHLEVSRELGIYYNTSDRAFHIRKGLESKFYWVLRIFIFPLMFLPVALIPARPSVIALIMTTLLSVVFAFQVYTGKFKRKRKMNRTVATIVAIGKLKRAIARRREAREREELALKTPVEGSSLEEVALLDSTESASLQSTTSSSERGAIVTKLEPTSLSPLSPGTVSGEGSPTTTQNSNQETESVPQAVPAKEVGEISLPPQENSGVQPGHKKKTLVRIVRDDNQAFKGRRTRRRRGPIHTAKQALHSTNFYIPATKKMDWDTLNQHSAGDTQFFDLFLDLTYVAAFYRLGDFSALEFGKLEGAMAFVYFGQFTALYHCWERKTTMSATFVSPDVLHKVGDIVQGCMIAFMASHVVVGPTIDTFNSSVLPTGFAWGRIVYEVTIVVQIIEVFYANKVAAKVWAFNALVNSAVTIVSVLLSLISLSNNADFRVTVAFWALPFWINYLYRVLVVQLGWVSNSNSFPLDLHYLYHRIGELTIIAVGEGVLSLILTGDKKGHDHSLSHYGAFVLAYFILCTVRMLHFFVEPSDLEKTAGRQSRIRGNLHAALWPGVMASISGLGGLSLYFLVEDHREKFKLDPEYDPDNEYLWHALPFVVFIGSTWLQDFLNEGSRELILPRSSDVKIRLAIYALKVFVVVLPILSVWSRWHGVGILTADLVTLLIAVLAHVFHAESRLVAKAYASTLGQDVDAHAIEDEDEGRDGEDTNMMDSISCDGTNGFCADADDKDFQVVYN